MKYKETKFGIHKISELPDDFAEVEPNGVVSLSDDVTEWLSENAPDWSYVYDFHEGVSLYFDTEMEASFFLMKWNNG